LTAVQEIEASYGGKAGRIVRGWYETQDEIGREIEPVEGPHAGLFAAQQRAGAARTRMGERAQAKAEEHCEEHRDCSQILPSHRLMTPGGCIPIG
jgi:hypothetical protein